MTELDAGLLAILSALTVGLVQAIKAPISGDMSRWGPLLSLGAALALSTLWTWLGAEIPEGVNPWAYLGLHGIAAGLMASGLYSTGRRVLTNGEDK